MYIRMKSLTAMYIIMPCVGYTQYYYSPIDPKLAESGIAVLYRADLCSKSMLESDILVMCDTTFSVHVLVDVIEV